MTSSPSQETPTLRSSSACSPAHCSSISARDSGPQRCCHPARSGRLPRLVQSTPLCACGSGPHNGTAIYPASAIATTSPTVGAATRCSLTAATLTGAPDPDRQRHRNARQPQAPRRTPGHQPTRQPGRGPRQRPRLQHPQTTRPSSRPAATAAAPGPLPQQPPASPGRSPGPSTTQPHPAAASPRLQREQGVSRWPPQARRNASQPAAVFAETAEQPNARSAVDPNG